VGFGNTLIGKGGTSVEREQQQPNLVKLSESENIRLQEPWQDIRELDVYDINGE